jgi:hypothetical protein
MRGCHSPGTGRITAPGSSWPQSTRIVQRKRRPTSKVDSMMVLRARRGGSPGGSRDVSASQGHFFEPEINHYQLSILMRYGMVFIKRLKSQTSEG